MDETHCYLHESFSATSPHLLLAPLPGITPDSQQSRGFKSFRRRSFLGSIGGEAGGGGSGKAPFVRQPPDNTTGKMKLFADHERYDKLKGKSEIRYVMLSLCNFYNS